MISRAILGMSQNYLQFEQRNSGDFQRFHSGLGMMMMMMMMLVGMMMMMMMMMMMVTMLVVVVVVVLVAMMMLVLVGMMILVVVAMTMVVVVVGGVFLFLRSSRWIIYFVLREPYRFWVAIWAADGRWCREKDGEETFH